LVFYPMLDTSSEYKYQVVEENDKKITHQSGLF